MHPYSCKPGVTNPKIGNMLMERRAIEVAELKSGVKLDT